MKIVTIGRGMIGGGLAGLWRDAGHEVEELGRDGGDASDADAVLVAVPGTGLGIQRSDPQHPHADSTHPGHPNSPSFSRLPADARAKAREHKLLILTKANSRSTVHRPSYLDYVGVKKFDAEAYVAEVAKLARAEQR